MMRKLIRRLDYLLHRARLERELEDEMAAHREMMPGERRPAFGNLTRLREETRDQWGWSWVDDLRQDLAYGARCLWRSPGFTLTAVAVLALGIGVNLAEVQIFQAAANPPRFRDAPLIRHFTRMAKDGRVHAFPTPAVDSFERYSTSLAAVILETRGDAVLFEDHPKDLRSLFVSGNYFSALGLTPAYGRLINEEDNLAGAPPVVVVGYAFWQDRLGGLSAAIGRSIRLNGKPVQVVGVAPYDFTGLATGGSPVWLPMNSYPYLVEGSTQHESWDSGNNLYGRLKPGVTSAAVEEEMTAILGELRKQQPRRFQLAERIRAERLDTPSIGPQQAAALATWALLVFLVLLSACANLGNMLLARGLIRRREIDIRLAVGATRWRLIRQLITENLLLAATGAAVALIICRAFGRLTLSILEAPPSIRLQTDWRMLLAGAVCTVVSVLAFGLAPAIQIVRPGHIATRGRKVLVGVQVAVSCVLLILGSVFTRGVLRHFAAVLHFDYRHMMVVDPSLDVHHIAGAAAAQTLREIAERVEGLPGIAAVGLSVVPPLGNRAWLARPNGSPQQLFMNRVDVGYFRTLGLPVLRGRLFLHAEPDSVILSESAARKLWPEESPLGKTLEIGSGKAAVVGVVADSGANTVAFPDSVEVYAPLSDSTVASAMLVVRTNSDPIPLLAAVSAAASRPGLVSTTASMQANYDLRALPVRLISQVVGLLGGVATLLAAVGIFGLVAFTVSQRTREIGIRMALGARSPDVVRTVVQQYAVPVGVGAGCGLAIACLIAGVLSNQIFGISLFDPLSYAAGLLVFGGIALAAALWPARRALSISPSSALRYE